MKKSVQILSLIIALSVIFGLISAGCMAIDKLQVTLASGVCLLVRKIGPGACVGFLVWGTGSCPLVCGTESCSLDGKTMSGGVF